MGTILLKRLPLIIGLFLLMALCLIGFVSQLEFSGGISDNSSTPSPNGTPGAALTPVNPPRYGDDYCGRVNQWEASNPFRGWPTDNTSLHTPGTITMHFCDPSYGQSWEHEGLDFGFYLGTHIVATADAQIVQAGFHTLLGNMVLLCANGWCARYGHLDSLAADIITGGSVTKGQILGLVGQTGNAFGIHLHYDIYNSEGFWDPWPTLGR